VVYPLSLIPEKYRIIAALNPLVQVIELFRFAFLGTGTIRSDYIFMSLGITFFILLSGIAIFNRVEKRFMDTV
jgi:lipopolysaccharide transport system permease protein